MVKVVLKDVRMAFADIWDAKAFEPGADPKFGATFLFGRDHPATALVNAAIQEAANETWGDSAADNLEAYKDNPNKFCFGNGDKKKKYDGFEGNLYITSKNSSRPNIFNRDKSALVKADGKPYSGCYVNAIIDVWAQKGQYAGIRSSLMGVQFVRDGDAFSGGAVASEDDFDDLGDGADAPDMGTNTTAAASGGFV